MDKKQLEVEASTKEVNRNLLFAGGLFFALATAAQYNDPDPELWMPVYGAPCVLTCMASVTPTIIESFVWLSMITVDMFVTLLLLFYTIWLNGLDIHSSLHTEIGREVAGLVILIVWLIILMLHNSWFSSSKWSVLRLSLFTVIFSTITAGIGYYLYFVSEDEKCSTHLI